MQILRGRTSWALSVLGLISLAACGGNPDHTVLYVVVGADGQTGKVTYLDEKGKTVEETIGNTWSKKISAKPGQDLSVKVTVNDPNKMCGCEISVGDASDGGRGSSHIVAKANQVLGTRQDFVCQAKAGDAPLPN